MANEKDTTHNLKNAETFLLNILTNDISLDNAKNLYKNLTEPSITVLKKSTGRSKEKRENILNVLNDLESFIFDGVCSSYQSEPKPEEPGITDISDLESEEYDAQRTKDKD